MVASNQKNYKELSFCLLFFAFFTLFLFGACRSVNAVDEVNVNFSYVKTKADDLAKKSYSRPDRFQNSLTKTDYEQICFDSTKMLWKNEKLPFGLELFHLGYIYNTRIPINEFKGNYTQELRFTNDLFSFGSLAPQTINRAKALNGYAGFKILYPLNEPNKFDEVISFPGNVNFRALGHQNIYGAYANALDFIKNSNKLYSADFTGFWLGKPDQKSKAVTFYALADSPDASAAYEFKLIPGNVTELKIRSIIFPRKKINLIGISPLKSFFLYGENSTIRQSYYPEIHNSDGLIIAGEKNIYWQPLKNPEKILMSEYDFNNFKYFGLLQRDRNYEQYLNPSNPFQLMPNVWVTPNNNWGKGSIVLREEPANNELSNNIAAFWKPDRLLEPGKPYSFDYTLHWSMEEPASNKAHVISTNIGRKNGVYTFLVIFSSDTLKKLSPVTHLTPNINTGDNAVIISRPEIQKDPFNSTWRIIFSVKPKGSDENIPLNVSCSLSHEKEVITETWNYKWLP